MNYVLTSSNDFNTTVQHIIKGLNSAGFSDKDYRLAEPVKPQVSEQPPVQIDITELQGVSDTEAPSETEQDDFAGLDGKSIGAELERRREQEKSSEITPKADSMLDDANKAGEAYNNAVKQGQDDPQIQNLPWEVREQLAIPVHGGGRQIIDVFSRHKGEFENVVIIGSDDAGVEHTFDFSSVLKHLVISPVKDENEHFDPTEVRNLLLRELR